MSPRARESRPGGHWAAEGLATSPSVTPTTHERHGGAPWCCPDCTATLDRDTLTVEHDEGCPVGAEGDRVSAADRDFFEAHPWAQEYRRPLAWSEGVALAAAHGLPLGTRLAGRVTVRRVAPGVRARLFQGVTVRPPAGAEA